MPESGTSGSVRGALRNERPYRERRTWSMTSKAEKPYLSVKLDDPSFAAAILCRLVGIGEERQNLVWSR